MRFLVSSDSRIGEFDPLPSLFDLAHMSRFSQGSNSSPHYQRFIALRLSQPVSSPRQNLALLLRLTPAFVSLVIAFNYAYFAVSYTVFKNRECSASGLVLIELIELSFPSEFAHVYYRRHYEGGGRTI